MKNLTKSLILGSILALMYLPPLYAQTEGSTSADTRPSAASPTTPGQAPDEVMKKLSDLVHTGKYEEAQQLTSGLLVAYPTDQRLIKAKTLLDKALASPKPSEPVANSNLPTSSVASPQPVSNLTGMDKVDYNALIVLARQAQQDMDVEQQKAALKQFMDQSTSFLQKHPDQILLWQLRAASAISLNDPMAGFDAGQNLLAAGAADNNDPNLQQLLAELKNKGWLDKLEAAKQAKDGWILGTWSLHYTWRAKSGERHEGDENIEFSISDSVIEGYGFISNGVKKSYPSVKVTLLGSGEIHCEDNLQPALSCEIADHNRTMKIVWTPSKYNKGNINWLLHKQ